MVFGGKKHKKKNDDRTSEKARKTAYEIRCTIQKEIESINNQRAIRKFDRYSAFFCVVARFSWQTFLLSRTAVGRCVHMIFGNVVLSNTFHRFGSMYFFFIHQSFVLPVYSYTARKPQIDLFLFLYFHDLTWEEKRKKTLSAKSVHQ